MQPARLSILSDIGGATTAASVSAQLSALAPSLPLVVEINSEGGSVSEAVAIYNLLRSRPGDVTVEIIGWALSAATVVAMAGRKIRAHASSLLMVHAPWIDHASGNAGTLRERADMLDQVAGTMRAAYARTKQEPRVIAKWLDGDDHWFTADQALALGLIDEVIDEPSLAIGPAVLAACRFPVPDHLTQRIQTMTTTTHASAPSAEQIQAAALRADGERRQAIRARFGEFGKQPAYAELMRSCEDDPAVTADLAAQRLLARMGAGVEPANPMGAHPMVGVTAGGGDSGAGRVGEFRAAAIDVLLQRAGVRVAEPHPAARELQRLSIVSMAERILSMQGKASAAMTKGEIVKAAMTTSDFPLLLSGLTGRALRAGYDSAPATHSGWTGEREVSDFKTQTLAMLSEAPGLERVSEAGEYRFGSFAEAAETFAVETYGKIVRFTRQALINDDLGALTNVPNSLGAASRRLEADMVYSKLTSNPVMSDGKALFHADHGNLVTAAALGVDSLGAARAAMRQQRGINGLDYLDPQPRYLIVPVTLETKAEALLNSTVDPARSNDTENPAWIRRLILVADPRLDASSEAAWYLATDPRQIEGIVRAYLAGEPRPFLDDHDGWVTDTTDYKVRLDVGVGVIDYRGLLKNPGA